MCSESEAFEGFRRLSKALEGSRRPSKALEGSRRLSKALGGSGKRALRQRVQRRSVWDRGGNARARARGLTGGGAPGRQVDNDRIALLAARELAAYRRCPASRAPAPSCRWPPDGPSSRHGEGRAEGSHFATPPCPRAPAAPRAPTPLGGSRGVLRRRVSPAVTTPMVT